MSKKDYQAIARAIFDQRRLDGGLANTVSVLSCLTDRLANYLACDNPRFDRAGFIEACETGRCKGMPQ